MNDQQITPVDIAMRQHDRADTNRRNWEMEQIEREIRDRTKPRVKFGSNFGVNLATVMERN